MTDFLRSYIRDGDTTTTDGRVAPKPQQFAITYDGAHAAFEGDPVWCPACKSYGVTQCVPPFRRDTGPDGRQRNLDGDLCLCKCPKPPRLVARHRWVARLSVTLNKLGIEMKSYRGPDRILLDGKPTSVRAQQLGKWLALQPFCGLPKSPEDITGKQWEAKITGRTGIAMFDRYWARTEESAENASGGHIDLWNGKRLTINSTSSFFSTFGRSAGIAAVSLAGFGYSDLGNSRTILFWQVK